MHFSDLTTQAVTTVVHSGFYHSGALLLSLHEIGKRMGITPLRYDFSDPQSGKDICDRKTAPMKSHIRRWVNEKNDVLTALDMKTALKSHGGLRDAVLLLLKLIQLLKMQAHLTRYRE